jgi:cytochrome b subunit of formate dehydrogenase
MAGCIFVQFAENASIFSFCFFSTTKIYHPFIIIIVIIVIIIIFRTLQLTPILMKGCITWMLF